MWDDIEHLLEEYIGKLRYLIQLPWVIFLVVVLFPLLVCGILRNNLRILWRYFKHAVYLWKKEAGYVVFGEREIGKVKKK